MLDIPGDKMIVLFVTCAILQAVTGNPINQGPPSSNNITCFEYFIAARDVLWDYCPQKENLIDDNDGWINNTHVTNPDTRFNCKFWKIKYYPYTDDTFTTEMEQDGHMGILGPTIYACHDSMIKIHFFNSATFRVSIHSHFAEYGKDHEGAFYQDGNHGPDDFVEPGATYTYNWFISSHFRLGDGDEPCSGYAAHSHFMVDMEMNVGLFCFLVVCKEGYLKYVNGKYMRRDVEYEVFYAIDLINEAETLMTDKNMDLCGDPVECRRLLDEHTDHDWLDQFLADSINGYRGGNGPPATVCAGSRVAVYTYSLMAEIHYFEIRGQTFLFRDRRRAGTPLFPATFMTGLWEPQAPGNWLVACLNTEHYKQGMNAIVHVIDCNKTIDNHLDGTTKTYYIEAKMVTWCYDNKTGQDLFHGRPLNADDSDSANYFNKTEGMIGGCYHKAQFVGYKHRNMTEETERPAYLGILGPVLTFEEGNALNVYLKNSLPFRISFYLQGVMMTKEMDGTYMKGEPVKYVEPDETEMYTYTVPKAVSPGDEDLECTPFMYWSAYDTESHTAAGLVGPALSCKSGELDCVTDGQKGIDASFFLYFARFNENVSPLLQKNIQDFTNNAANAADEDFIESNFMYGINGLSYGNLQGIKICNGQTVALYMLSIGENEALYSPVIEGNSFHNDGSNQASKVLITGMADPYVMNPHNNGKWAIFSANVNHFKAGVTTTYTVECCGDCPDKPFDFQESPPREYFLCINEREWDYSPATINGFTGRDYSQPGEPGYDQVRSDGIFLGSKYMKAIFFQYTDDTFEEEIPKPDHLGFLGPPLYCNVGDTMIITVKNNATFNYSLYSPGVAYDKEYGGMNYNDNVTSTGHSIPPGGNFTYIWRCETEHGPAEDEPNCHNRIYMSANHPDDVYSGLIGPLVICKNGILFPNNNTRRDGYREFFIFMIVANERFSHYFPQHLKNIHNATFETSNEMDTMNGLSFGNLHGLVMYRCENVAWYIFSAGNEMDYHTLHFHAHVLKFTLTKTVMLDVIESFPITGAVAEMYTFNAGTWAAHCHVGEHAFNGMFALYHVKKECRKFNQYP